MTKAVLNLDTALGTFQFVAECDHQPDEVSLNLKVFEPRYSLPPGMSVLSCRAVFLRVTTRVEIGVLRWSCQSPMNVAGSPCTGECLDAQEWEAGGRLVVVGTEDAGALASRLSFLQLDPQSSVVPFTPQTLEMKIPRIPAFSTFGLHFVVAENTSPEPVDASAWFVVDIPHKNLAASDAV